MNENTEHRLWIVEEDARRDTHFFVREVDVEPVHPQKPPQHWSAYRVAGKPEWFTLMLDYDGFRSKTAALECAIRYTDDAIYDWEQKRKALEEQLGEDEAAWEDDEDENENG